MAQSMGKLYVEIAGNASKLVNEVGKVNKSLGTLELAAKRLQSNLIGMFGAYQVIAAAQHIVTTLGEFDKAMTAVKVITGASVEQFNRLEKSALKLGSTTQYTAKQVAELQLEFARLGFSTREILQSTDAVVNLATTTGEGLARSAEIAGSTLRAFNLDASEMGRVTDVMAGALNESALTLDSFADGIKYVAPVAASVNVTLEETAAMMGILADAGIKGSMAGTSLRRIFTMLTDTGKPLQERLQGLAKAGITLAQANDEVGLYAQTSLLIITKHLPKILELEQKLKDATGATKEMADVMQNNLATSITKVGTAYDALILSFGNSKGGLKSQFDTLAGSLRIMASDAISFGEALGAIGARITGNIAPLQAMITQLDLYNMAQDEAGKKDAENIERQAKQALETFGTNTEAIKKAYQQNVHGAEIYERAVAMLLQTEKDKTSQLVKNLELTKEQTKEYEELIKATNDIGNAENRRLLQSSAIKAFNDSAASRSSGLLSSTQAGNFNVPPPSEEARTLWEIAIEQQERFGDAAKKAREELFGSNKEKIQQQVELIHFWGDAISNVIDNVIAKDQDFAKSAAETTARIIDATKNEIAAYIAKAAAKALALNPTPAGIATASAIIGIGLSLVSGLLKRFAKTSDTNVRDTSSTASKAATQSGNIQGSVVIRGQDLYVAMNNYSYNNRYTKAGG